MKTDPSCSINSVFHMNIINRVVILVNLLASVNSHSFRHAMPSLIFFV